MPSSAKSHLEPRSVLLIIPASEINIASVGQIFDTGVKIVDRNCADITFSEAFLFSNMKPEFDIKLEVFCHKLRGEVGGSGPRNWFQGGNTKR